MKKWVLLPLLACLAAAPAGAATVDLGFNDYSAQAVLGLPLHAEEYGSIHAEGRLLYNDDEETKLASGGLLFSGQPGNVPGLDLGIGGLLYVGHTDESQDLLALGVGGRVSFAPPVLGGFGLSGKLFYAPNIFAGLDAERLVETGVRLSYAVTPKVQLFAEYQNLRCDFDDRDDRSIDEGVRVGFTASF